MREGRDGSLLLVILDFIFRYQVGNMGEGPGIKRGDWRGENEDRQKVETMAQRDLLEMIKDWKLEYKKRRKRREDKAGILFESVGV